MGLDDAFADRQPQAGTAELALRFLVGVLKTVEDKSLQFRGNADAGVLDLKQQLLIVPLYIELHQAAGCEFERVINQVAQHVFQTRCISAHPLWQLRI